MSPGPGPWDERQDERDPVRPRIANADSEDQEREGEDQGQRSEEGKEGERKAEEERPRGQEEVVEDTKDKAEEEGGVRKPKVGRIPTPPTKKELEEHLPLHADYKSWCPICVAGEGIHNQARKSTEEKGNKIGITISMDYCFLTTEGESEPGPKVLVIHDDRLDAIWALEVKAKGPSAEVVTWIVGELEES